MFVGNGGCEAGVRVMSNRFDILQWFKRDPARTISRHTYLSSDIPTTEELEAVKRTRERVLLVIKMRWVLLSLFALFGFYASYVYDLGGPEGLSLLHIAVPAAAFLAAIGYNGWYHYFHDWLSNYRRINLAQLISSRKSIRSSEITIIAWHF